MVGEGPHRLDGSEEIADATLFAPVGEFDVGGRVDLQALENWRQVVRNNTAPAFDNRATPCVSTCSPTAPDRFYL